jgi:hypothetical protein
MAPQADNAGISRACQARGILPDAHARKKQFSPPSPLGYHGGMPGESENPYGAPVAATIVAPPRWRRIAGVGLYALASLPCTIGWYALRGIFIWSDIEQREGITEHRLSRALIIVVALCLATIVALVWAGSRLRRHKKSP